MKKVLHLLASNKYSGAENIACMIISNMKNEYDMVYCSPDGPIAEALSERKIKFYPIKKLCYFEVKKIVKEFKPDVIHAHDNRATVIATHFSRECKIISHIHGNNKIMNTINLKTLLFNYCSKKVYKFIWVSDSSLDEYYFKDNVRKKSQVLYNVIDKNSIIKKANSEEIKEEYDLIFLGRLGYPKNPQRLIKIINMTVKKKKNLKVAIVGDGPDKEMIERLIEEYELNKNVKLYGYKSNPYPILKKSKILIMTSIYEGTPMCALEAQALGKPIIATPVDGLKKIIKNGHNGYLIDNNQDFADRIINMLKKDYKKKVDIMFNDYNNLDKYIRKIHELY